MYVSVRVLAFGFATAIAGLSSFAVSSALADIITINQQSVQMLKPAPVVCFAGTNTVCATTQPQVSVGGNDTLNFKITFTNQGANGGTLCNPFNSDIITHGLSLIAVTQLACADPFSAPFITAIPSFV